VSRFDAKRHDVEDYLTQVQEAIHDLLVDAGTRAQRSDLNEALHCVYAAKRWVHKTRNR
jgi:hypothetical protein